MTDSNKLDNTDYFLIQMWFPFFSHKINFLFLQTGIDTILLTKHGKPL